MFNSMDGIVTTSHLQSGGGLCKSRLDLDIIIVLLRVFTALTLLTSDLTVAQCPSQCSCSTYKSGQITSCGPGMTSFPFPVPDDTLVFSLSALPGQMPNNIPSLSQSNLVTLTKVKRLQIASSNLRTIAAHTFASLPDLEELDLKGNRLVNLTTSVFQGLGMLKLLDLSDNVGCHIESDTFDNLTSLSTLRLSGIGLTSVGHLLSKLTSLQTCDLHGNRLIRLESGSFAQLFNLRHLDVSFNNLREIQPGMKTVLSGLTDLRLEYNPWRCNCALIWVKSLPAKFIHPSFIHGGGIVCDQPDSLQFRDLRNAADAEMTCTPAHIVSCSNTQPVNEGNAVSVTCKVVGDPFPDVVWNRPDASQYSHTLQSNVTTSTTLSLQVTEFSQHNGKWELHVINQNGSASKMIDIDILTTTTTTTATTTTTTTTTTPTPTAAQKTSTSKIVSSSSPSSSMQQQTGPAVSTNQSPTNQNSLPPGLSTLIPTPSSTTPSTSMPSEINIVLVVAASAGAVVCVTGFAIFAAVIYKSKRKRRIAAKRKSVYSTAGEIEMFNRNVTKISGSFRFLE